MPSSSILRPGGQEPPDVAELYRAHAKTVARWALRLAGPGIDVEDIVHEVFLVAHRRLGDFRHDGQVTTWLYRTTLRVVQYERRRLGLRRRLALQASADGVEPRAESDEFARREARQTVYRILEGMKDKYRTVFILFELEHLPGDRIAEILSARTDTVWVWLHRARAQFLERLQELKRQEGPPDLVPVAVSVLDGRAHPGGRS